MIDYSAPIARVYALCVDRLLINIASHFNVSAMGNTGSFTWQAKKLAELGRLNAESRRIMAEMIGGAGGLAEIALETALRDALKLMDKDLAEAAKKGLAGGYTGGMTPQMRYIFRQYYDQAVRDVNLVNTVMLTDSANKMRRVISSIAKSQSYLRDVTQGVLNTLTGEVITGITSTQQAVRQAMQQLSIDGITGFRDKAGKLWTPDAYLYMDIQTTAGNVAREASFQQAREFSGGLIVWPVNATARPGCAPWQGKVCSLDGESGYTTDLDGNQIRVYALAETTYGQPAGIGGINCHHTPPSPYIAGFSTIPEQTKTQEQNAQDYATSQRQRYLENRVKLNRRAAVLHQTTGDDAAFAASASKARKAMADLREFIDQTGRTYRSDRIQVYGWDRSTSGRARAS